VSRNNLKTGIPPNWSHTAAVTCPAGPDHAAHLSDSMLDIGNE
jgi:hypothetical protein